ncbi:oxidoreductase [Streptomyces sp. NPDC093111]|uniref:oxidoreductase n=1 Tax=Streptomyces sp. NPDC093111 TaxID=3154978 RepID=UPI00343A23F9
MSKVWLITGANSGFGRAFAQAAIGAGDVVVAAARRAGTLDDLVAAHPDQVEAVALDVTDHAAVDRVVAGVAERHGRIDVLVNNAGRTHVGSVEETDDAELRSLFDVHVFGPAALTRAVLPHMRARRSGAIVQLSSVGGQMSMAGFGAYSATKFALEGLSEALAAEVNPLGIRVLIVEPGAFRTSLFGNGSLSTDTIADYADTVGATRAFVEGGDGGQAGDPAKAAAAVLAALDAEEPPLRLALGSDSIDTIHGHLEQVRGDLVAWEKVGRETGFDEA